VLFSGVEAEGVRVSVSVVDCPTASAIGARPLTVRPGEGKAVIVKLLSGRFPVSVSSIVSVLPVPGMVLESSGWIAIATASTAGTVNVSAAEADTAGLATLVAVTLNDTWVCGAGSCPLGSSATPTSAVCAGSTSSWGTLTLAVKPGGVFVTPTLKVWAEEPVFLIPIRNAVGISVPSRGSSKQWVGDDSDRDVRTGEAAEGTRGRG
jgi:hypothetical protein